MPRLVFYHLINILNRNRKRPYLLTLLLISLLITIIVDVIFINSIQTFFYPFESLSCYRIENLNTYPDISQIKTREGKTIFFHETSCKSYTEGKTILNSRQACAIESAAKLNPSFDIFVLFTSPGVFINNNTQSDRIIKALLAYPNVKFLHINYNNYTEGTPVESLYKSGKIESSYYAVSHASDVLRYLTLWKYGGIYLDLDVIVMKPLDGLQSNYAGAESDDNVAAGVMNFAPDGLGHFLAEECLIDLSEHFTGYDWGYNGPGVITRLLRRICRAKKAKDMVNKNCRGFTIHPPEYFYPIPWWNWTMYFDEKYTENMLKEKPVVRMSSTGHNLESFNISELTTEQQKILIDIRRRKTDLLLEIQQLKDELCEVVSEMESLDSGEEGKNSNKAKMMSIGRKKFNMDPKKGIEYLIEKDLIQNTPESVAQFLHKGEGLNKTAIGDYLGEKNEFNEKVLQAFVGLHDFTDLILVQALRQFLWSFRLPGEAQKIDRMMECFAKRYCECQGDNNIFQNSDTCYVLSFAIIMLNTSLHNPSVKEKPTIDQFINMNRGINMGQDLPRELLVGLYESIKAEPFKIPEDDGNDLMHTFFNPDKEGWLWKQGGRYKSWKRRWFILNDNCLYYFEYTTDKEPRGIIPLENISVRECTDRQKQHCFELYASGGADFIKACKTDSEGKVVEGKHTVYRMSASSEEEKVDWMNRLSQSISHNPFYDMLASRKRKAQYTAKN